MIDKNILISKAQGFTIAFDKMGKEERTINPSGTYAEDYNELRNRVIALLPDLEPIMPPAVRIVPGRKSGVTLSTQSFAEINAYCEQISQMLTGIDE